MTTASSPTDPGSLVAQLLGEAVREAEGQPGALVRDVPYLAPKSVLPVLADLTKQGVDLRIAYLDSDATKWAEKSSLDDSVFTVEVEQAEAWRNMRNLEALIVVITEIDAAKLTSLEDFVSIGPSHLRRFLVERAVVKFSEPNEVIPRWWQIIGSDEQMSFSDLVDYYLALSPLEGADLRDQAALQVNRLGLLPDPAFFEGPSEKQLGKRLDDNRTVALRLANFSEEDRQKVDKALADEPDPERRADLRGRLRDLQTYRRGGELALTFGDALQLLHLRSGRRPTPPVDEEPGDQEPPSPPPEAPPPPENLTLLAAENLLRDDDTDDEDTADDTLNRAVAEIDDQVAQIDDSTVRPEPVNVTLPSGFQVDETVSTDVVSLINRLVGAGRYGGLIRSTEDNIASMVRGFHQSAEVVRYFERERIDEFLNAFAARLSEAAQLRDAFDVFDDARNELLSYLRELCVAPLLVATAPATSERVAAVTDAYRELVVCAAEQYPSLHAEFGDDARALIEQLMLIDTVFLDNGVSLDALLTPLHPLHLWHYTEYASVIRDQRTLLDERDRELVRSQLRSGGVPLFFASIGVPRTISDTAPPSLPYSGRFRGLPHFSIHADVDDQRDGVTPVRRLVETFVALHPAATEGFRLALLEPPDVGVFLAMCCDLAESSQLRGAHITLLRRGSGAGVELNLSADEERRIQQRFGDHVERRFTFETLRVAPEVVAPSDGLTPHVFVAFDQTDRQATDAGGSLTEIQPLAHKRRLVYRIATHSLDLEPALGGILAKYASLASLAVGAKVNSYQSIHQGEELEARFKDAAQLVPWYVIADGHVDRDLDLGTLRVLTDSEGARDVVAFSRSPAAFRRTLRDVARQFNTAVTDDALDTLLHELSDLLDAGLLSLRPSRSGETAQAHVRGLLGLLVGVQAIRSMTPEGHDRIILSLDSEQARRWLHLADDPRRADLLVIDAADDRFNVTVVEVKTRQDTTSEYTVTGGKISGPAIAQMLSTHRLLRQVFDPEHAESLVTPSRREVLREHLYRELSKARYDNESKQRWAKRSEELFDGAPALDLRCALLEVHLGRATTTLEPARAVQAEDGDELVPIALIELNEDGVASLESALTPPEGTDGEAEPSPPGGPTTPPLEDSPEDRASITEADEAGPVEASGEVFSEDSATAAAADRPRALLGSAAATYGQPREIWFDPQKPDEPLINPHISISGETGSGKTQATKAMLHELMPQGLPALILDFKDDYSNPDYAEAGGFTVHDATYGSLPFNPMVPTADPQSGRVNPISHVHELASTLQRIYKLGDQQAFTLREAMKETYAIAGVDDRPFVPEPDQEYLPFEAIREVLVREDAATLLGRLSPIFDLGLFSRSQDLTSLNELLSASTVIRLSQLPGDQVKNAVAEFFLMALYSHLIRQEHPHRLERLLVLDEAWRLVASPFLEPLMREGRAFGLGVIVATQFPRDLPNQIAGSTATRLFFNQSKAEQVREIQRTLVGKTSGTEADHLGNLIRGLAPLECIFQNHHYQPWIRLRATPYFARVSGDEGD